MLEIIAAGAPIKATELAKRMDLPRSTLYRSIASLMDCGFVEESDDGSRYVLGSRFLRIAMSGLSAANLMRAIAPVVTRILQTYAETVFLARLRDRSIEIVDVRTPTDQAMSYIFPGLGRRPAHACSSAKAIAAFLPTDERDSLLEEPFSKLTEKTIVEREQLVQELETIRLQGFALCDGEIGEGVSSVAVPIRLDGIGVRFSLGIVGPSLRIQEKLDNGVHNLLLQESTHAAQLIPTHSLMDATQTL